MTLLRPLYADVPDGEQKMQAYLAEDGLPPTKLMLRALGILTPEADACEPPPKSLRSTVALVALPHKVIGSLTSALAKQEAIFYDAAAKGVQPGCKCLRNTCGQEYVDESSDMNTCTHCPGEPVFHEGYKYWSCCPSRKTLDFEEFLNYKGCTEVQGCQWIKEETEEQEEKECRHDFFQTASDVVLSVFAKTCIPDKTVVQVNPDSLVLTTVYERTNKFSMKIQLGGTIIPDKCSVTLYSTKIDIKLKKSEGGAWAEFYKGDVGKAS